jgi:hypothetical protein
MSLSRNVEVCGGGGGGDDVVGRMLGSCMNMGVRVVVVAKEIDGED